MRGKAAVGVLVLMLVMLSVAIRSAAAGVSGHRSAPHVHKKHAQLKNPISMTGRSVQTGRTIFEIKCASCHGKDGQGGAGPDLADAHWIHGPSDGEVFHVISDGVAGTSMIGFRNLLPEQMRWHLVNYLRSIGKTTKPN